MSAPVKKVNVHHETHSQCAWWRELKTCFTQADFLGRSPTLSVALPPHRHEHYRMSVGAVSGEEVVFSHVRNLIAFAAIVK